uniref:Uncharacterized protein n=1 Tax=Oryza rufipogon TaxID=4529 RepID=A0A0E0RAA1_ORYRU
MEGRKALRKRIGIQLRETLGLGSSGAQIEARMSQARAAHGRQPLWRTPPSHLSIAPPRRQGDGAKEVTLVEKGALLPTQTVPKRTATQTGNAFKYERPPYRTTKSQ